MGSQVGGVGLVWGFVCGLTMRYGRLKMRKERVAINHRSGEKSLF